MTVRNLEYLFRPKSVALIGSDGPPGSAASVLAGNLFKAGFHGPVMPVNAKRPVIESVLTYPNVASLPLAADLAVISVPAGSVAGVISELGRRGTRAAVIVGNEFGDSAVTKREIEQAVLDAARPEGMRIVGPDSLGIMVPDICLNASFSHLHPKPGRLAFVAQSGAIVTSVLDWAHPRGIGFSHLVSLGDMADVDLGDMLDYLASDGRTQAVLLYIEAVTNARKFMSAARAAARMKPVVVVKAGRHAAGARAVASHTGFLAGEDAVYDAVFRRSGMLRVFSLEELFDAVELLAMAHVPRGDRLAILTNGGGMGVLATDALIDRGGHLAELSAGTSAKLDEVLATGWSHANPVDIGGDAPGRRYAEVFEALISDSGADAVLVIGCPTGVADGTESARAVADTSGGRNATTILTSWVGDRAAAEARRLFAERRIPTYDTPEQAVRGFMYLVDYRRRQQLLTETPPSVPHDFTPDRNRAWNVVRHALQERRPWLQEAEVIELLSSYGIPVVESRTVATPQEAAAVAAGMGAPVVLKISSSSLRHKWDVGGVALDLPSPAAVQNAAEAMLQRVAEAAPGVPLEGFSVSPMVRRPAAYELIAGMVNDPQFGPVILFGHGGTAVEVIDDKAIGLPPLNMHLARELMSRTRIHRLLRGYRGASAVDLDAIALTLMRVSQLVIDISEVAELDINPLIADEHGVLALDARVRISEPREADRLAIRPYPSELEERIPLGDGRTLLLRPILPEDEPSLQAAFAKLTPEEVRLRFFVPMKTLSHMTAARFTQIDYDREMALVLTEPGIPGKTEIFAVVGISADPDNDRAEYAIIVRGDMTGMGLGVLLMRRIIDYARSRGIREMYGDVLRDNTTMLKLCKVLGFGESHLADEPTLVRVTLTL